MITVTTSDNPSHFLTGMEATGHYWLALFSFLDEADYFVHVINPIQTDGLRKGTEIRKRKTDIVDSVLIADLIRYDSFEDTTLANEDMFSLRQFTRYRLYLVGTTGDFKRKITAILDQVFPGFDSVFSKVGVFGKASKAALPSLKSLYVQSLSLFTSRSNLFVIVILFATKSSLSKFNNRVLISYINFIITFYSCSLIASFNPFLSMILNFLLYTPMYGITLFIKLSDSVSSTSLMSGLNSSIKLSDRLLMAK